MRRLEGVMGEEEEKVDGKVGEGEERGGNKKRKREKATCFAPHLKIGLDRASRSALGRTALVAPYS